jgi:hypothetical protein
MKGPIEEREPVTHERRPDGIVEERPDRLARAIAFEQEDDLGLGQEDGVSLEGVLEILGAESGVVGEKRLRSPAGAGFQRGNKNEAIHGSKRTLPPVSDIPATRAMSLSRWKAPA